MHPNPLRGRLRGRGMALGLLVALAIVALTVAGCAEKDKANESSGATGINLAVQPFGPHVQLGETHPPYNSRPATSGWHRGAVARWGVYVDARIPDEVLVHNLEHGGIGIHFNCVEGCPDLIGDLAEIAGRYDKVVMSPYPDMDSRIALTAWTFLDAFDEFDERRITAFIDAHISSADAPEGSLPP